METRVEPETSRGRSGARPGHHTEGPRSIGGSRARRSRMEHRRHVAMVGNMRLLAPLVAAFSCAAVAAQAADAQLIAAAKKEGAVVWYTTQIVDQFARPAAASFEK